MLYVRLVTWLSFYNKKAILRISLFHKIKTNAKKNNDILFHCTLIGILF